MSNCSRCAEDVPDGTTHIFSGGEARAQKIGEALRSETSLCRKPVIGFKKSFVCPGCKRYMFDSIDPFKGAEGAECPFCRYVPWNEIHEITNV